MDPTYDNLDILSESLKNAIEFDNDINFQNLEIITLKDDIQSISDDIELTQELFIGFKREFEIVKGELENLPMNQCHPESESNSLKERFKKLNWAKNSKLLCGGNAKNSSQSYLISHFPANKSSSILFWDAIIDLKISMRII